MEQTVYIPCRIAEEGVRYLREHGFKIKEGSGTDEETMCREVEGCQAILLRTAHLTRKVLETEPQVRIIARHGVGLDIIDMAAATELGIQVTNTPGSNGLSVAEYTIGGMISAARKIQRLSAAGRRGGFFYKNRCQGSELSGKTLGLIGFGHIGSSVAKIAAMGFDMKIVVYKGHMEGKIPPDYVRIAEWDEVFQTADFISLHVPLRPENVNLVGEREFEMMKSSAIFVNTARGKLVDEESLLTALQRGQIAGAFLDVFSEEPISKDNPLLHLDNVTATPHCGASTNEALTRSAVWAAMEIDRFFKGKPVRWPVNAPAGQAMLLS